MVNLTWFSLTLTISYHIIVNMTSVIQFPLKFKVNLLEGNNLQRESIDLSTNIFTFALSKAFKTETGQLLIPF